MNDVLVKDVFYYLLSGSPCCQMNHHTLINSLQGKSQSYKTRQTERTQGKWYSHSQLLMSLNKREYREDLALSQRDDFKIYLNIYILMQVYRSSGK